MLMHMPLLQLKVRLECMCTSCVNSPGKVPERWACQAPQSMRHGHNLLHHCDQVTGTNSAQLSSLNRLDVLNLLESQEAAMYARVLLALCKTS